MKRILFLAALGFTLQAYAADDSIKKEAVDDDSIKKEAADDDSIKKKAKVYIALEDIEKAQRIMRRCKHIEAEFFEAKERKAEAQRVLDDYERTDGPNALAAIKKRRLLETKWLKKLRI